MTNSISYQDKLTRYLFLNLVYLLNQNRQVIKYEAPQHGDPNLGFAITMFRVDPKAHEYAVEYFRLLGKDPVRECGVTMSVSFDTPEQNNASREQFKVLVDEAEELLRSLADRTPHEHFFLELNPVLIGIENTQNNHFILLQANAVDDIDDRVLCEVLGDYDIVDKPNNEPVEIRVKCYRKKWRDGLVRHLIQLGIEENR